MKLQSKSKVVFALAFTASLGLSTYSFADAPVFPTNKSVYMDVAVEPASSVGQNRFYPIVNKINPTLPEGVSEFSLIRNNEELELTKLSVGFQISSPITLDDKLFISWSEQSKTSPVAIIIRNPLALGQIAFAYNSSKLSPAAKGVITQVAKELSNSGLRGVFVVSGADKPGSDNYNLTLSDKRAKRATAYLNKELSKLSISDAKVSYEFMGEIESKGASVKPNRPDRIVTFLVYPVKG